MLPIGKNRFFAYRMTVRAVLILLSYLVFFSPAHAQDSPSFSGGISRDTLESFGDFADSNGDFGAAEVTQGNRPKRGQLRRAGSGQALENHKRRQKEQADESKAGSNADNENSNDNSEEEPTPSPSPSPTETPGDPDEEEVTPTPTASPTADSTESPSPSPSPSQSPSPTPSPTPGPEPTPSDPPVEPDPSSTPDPTPPPTAIPTPVQTPTPVAQPPGSSNPGNSGGGNQGAGSPRGGFPGGGFPGFGGGFPGLGGGGFPGTGGNIPNGSSVGPGFWGSMNHLDEFFAGSTNREFKGEECEDGPEGSKGEVPKKAKVLTYYSPDTNPDIHNYLVDAFGKQGGEKFSLSQKEAFLNSITEAAKDQSGQKYIVAIACHGGPGGYLQGGINPGDITNAISRSGTKDASHILLAQGQCYPCTGGKVEDALRAQGIKPPAHLRGYPNANDVQWADVRPGGMVSHPLWRLVLYGRGDSSLGAFRGRKILLAAVNGTLDTKEEIGPQSESYGFGEFRKRSDSRAGFRGQLARPASARASPPVDNSGETIYLEDMVELMNQLYLRELEKKWRKSQPRHYYLEEY